VSHRFGLSMQFGSGRKSSDKKGGPRALPMQLIMEPGSRRVRMARLALAVNADENVEAWTLEIRNKKGELIRTLTGVGVPPTDLVWDGLDEQGNSVDADDVYYQLSIKTPNGIRRGQMLAMAAGTFDPSGLSIPGYKAPGEGPRLIPVLGQLDGLNLKRLTIDFTVLDIDDIAGWKVAIKSGQGKVVKSYRAKGDLPTDLVWDGRNSNRSKVKDPLGLVMEFSYTEFDGKTRTMSKPLFSQESYEATLRELRGRPSFRLLGFNSEYGEGAGARLRVWVPSGRALTTVNISPEGRVRRRRATPRSFYGLEPVRRNKVVRDRKAN
jgi:flagellar hook assembly protein FlgD